MERGTEYTDLMNSNESNTGLSQEIANTIRRHSPHQTPTVSYHPYYASYNSIDSITNGLYVQNFETVAMESTSQYTPAPSPGAPQLHSEKQSCLKENLEQCVQSNCVDLYEAGRVIMLAYQNNEPNCQETLKDFASENAQATLVPPAYCDVTNPSLPLILNFSNMVSNMLISCQLKMMSGIKNQKENILPKGSATNVKHTFFYPKGFQFTGEEIKLDVYSYRNEPFHLQLYHHLFDILSKSCSPQTSIQKGWILPGDKQSKTSTTPFPTDFYETLRKMFLQFFDLDYNELDASYWCDEYANLPFLLNLDDTSTKKEIFAQQQKARQDFLNSTFHTQLKNAINSLSTATFSPPQPGAQFGTFKLRNRNTKRDARKREAALNDIPILKKAHSATD